MITEILLMIAFLGTFYGIYKFGYARGWNDAQDHYWTVQD